MLKGLLKTAIEASLRAGESILEVYNSNVFETEMKEDKSPLTLADKKAHQTISKILETAGFPILSEEGRNIPYEERKSWQYFWMVDPLDGTKEFINRNGDFTVNIALIHDSEPILGVVYVPVSGMLYFASKGQGAFRLQDCKHKTIEDIFAQAVMLPIILSNEVYSVVASRSHMNEDTKQFIENIEREKGQIQLISRGSALKICMVAEGTADVYPRFGPTMEWDTAAGHAVAIEAGCTFLQGDMYSPFEYNKENLLNPYFIVSRN